jgi:hypothetical protein
MKHLVVLFTTLLALIGCTGSPTTAPESLSFELEAASSESYPIPAGAVAWRVVSPDASAFAPTVFFNVEAGTQLARFSGTELASGELRPTPDRAASLHVFANSAARGRFEFVQ